MVAAVYAQRLRNDAEIRWQWGMTLHARGQTDSATQQLEQGATSPETAIDLYSWISRGPAHPRDPGSSRWYDPDRVRTVVGL